MEQFKIVEDFRHFDPKGEPVPGGKVFFKPRRLKSMSAGQNHNPHHEWDSYYEDLDIKPNFFHTREEAQQAIMKWMQQDFKTPTPAPVRPRPVLSRS